MFVVQKYRSTIRAEIHFEFLMFSKILKLFFRKLFIKCRSMKQIASPLAFYQYLYVVPIDQHYHVQRSPSWSTLHHPRSLWTVERRTAGQCHQNLRSYLSLTYSGEQRNRDTTQLKFDHTTLAHQE